MRQLYNPNAAVRAMTVSAGVLYLGGDFTQLADAGGASPLARAYLAAIDLASGLPLGWDPGADGPVHALALNNGKILAGGDFGQVAGVPRTGVAELDAWPATRSATSWAPQLSPSPSIHALAAGAGVVYVGGAFNQAGGLARAGLVAVDAGGSTGWTTAFDAGFIGTGSVGNALWLEGGRLYAGGAFNRPAGRLCLAALDPVSGALLPWQPSDALAGGAVVHALALRAGILFVGGAFSGVWGGAAVSNIAAFRVSDAQAAWSQAGADDDVRALEAQADGRLLLGGNFMQLNGLPRRGFASLDAATGLIEAAASADLAGTGPKLWALGSSASEALLGGAFTSVAAVPVSSAAALSLGPYTAPTMTPAITQAGPAASPLYAYPNPMGCPVPSRLMLRAPKAGLVHWELITPRGSLVSEGRVPALAGDNSFPLSCAGLSPGLYLLRVSADYADGSHESYAPYKLAVLP